MAVMESTGGVDLGVKVGSTSGRNLEPPSADSLPESHGPGKESDRQQSPSALFPPMEQHTQPQQLQRPAVMVRMVDTNLSQDGIPLVRPHSDPTVFNAKVPQHRFLPLGQAVDHVPSDAAGTGTQGVQGNGAMAAAARSNSCGVGRDGDVPGEGFRKDIRDLEELLSKLNPMAEEFVPSSVVTHRGPHVGTDGNVGSGYADNMQHDTISNGNSDGIGHGGRRKKSNYSQGKRRMNSRTSMAQREEIIRRTVYVSDIDQQVTEEQLAALFITCGQVVDCRVCGDPNSVLRFAFIEFTDEEGAGAALSLSGTMLGYYPVRVLPSKTAIAPVNPAFLPRSEVEREMCARTVYCTNIDKKVSQAGVKLFFESICGEVHRLRLLGDYHHSTRIAFVEFVMAESAIAALNCSGAVLGSLAIRVSPSKTPVRSRAPRPSVR